MAQKVKALNTKPDDPSSIPGPRWYKERPNYCLLLQVVFWPPHTHHGICVSIYIHKLIKYFRV